ncbi:MAG: hypothetical protein KZQ83_19770 [gamma proteobacterium symbiont of Taylorina sp.]|nr:hypothetical protein [gamma proteobacterium symbiont of Taylorina sp.]
MKHLQFQLLRKELALMTQAEDVLGYSYNKCIKIGKVDNYDPDQLEIFESLTSRFARLSDIITQKIFRLIDKIDLDDDGSVRDRINRAEKKGLIDNAETFIFIRELRNRIAHEYIPEAIQLIFHQVLENVPTLFKTVEKINLYSQKYHPL